MIHTSTLTVPCRSVLFAVLITALPLSYLPGQEPNFPEKVGKDIYARLANPLAPTIDGRLDDPAWLQAASFSDLVQKDPVENAPPSESTLVYISYDPANLYVGVRAFDSQPDRIVGRLGRRDEFNESDWLWFSIDSRHDHQTGFGFAVNPAGVKVDMVHFNDTQDDRSWDGVWDCQTSVDGEGWCAEFRIPLAMLRFSAAAVHTWGFQFGRTIQRKRENDWWVLRPRGTSGYVSRFGHLRGLTGLSAPRKIEILPYVVARSDRLAAAPPSDQQIRTATGLDMRYGVTAGSTIEATFNPDFGQVEADPAVLTLTVYETFYPERRPFFIEGANFFKTPLLLFHSRRIGRAGPGRLPLAAGDVLLDSPDATTIAAAAKWTGKSPRGLAFGVLGALTTREFAHVLDAINRPRQRLIEPTTAHGVVRLTQDFAHGNSYLGGIATAVERGSGDDDAYTGGVDWDWKFHQNVYQFSGQLIASRIRSATATPPAAGWGGYWNFRKRGGRHVQWGLSGKALDAKLDFNDLGFLRRNNQLDLEGRIAYLLPDPNRLTRSAEYALEINRSSRLTDGLKLGASYSFIASQQFLNYYWLGLGAGFAERSFDDLDTRGGPPIVKPRSFSQWLWFGSDSRKSLSFTLTAYRGTNRGGSHWHSSYLLIQIKPSDNITFSVQPSYSFNRNIAQWVNNIDDSGDGTIDHLVYATLVSRVVDLTLRSDFTFHPNLSVQFYMQPFIAAGRYEDFKELARPKSFQFTPYAYNAEPNFNYKALNSNMVLRWEYRPGSTVFVVWQQQRSDYDNPGELKVFRDFKSLFGAPGNHIFLIKTNFWINL